jgi:glucose-1-phosphate thymidylyltransferase
VQPSPDGLAQAFIIGDKFIGNAPARWCWATTSSTATTSRRCWPGRTRTEGATVFAYHVQDPERYGVVAFDAKGKASSIEEKPKQPKSITR